MLIIPIDNLKNQRAYIRDFEPKIKMKAKGYIKH